VMIFPNPVNEVIHVRSQGESIYEVSLIDVQGRVVLTKHNINDRAVSLDTKHIEVGTYQVSVYFRDDKKINSTVIIQM